MDTGERSILHTVKVTSGRPLAARAMSWPSVHGPAPDCGRTIVTSKASKTVSAPSLLVDEQREVTGSTSSSDHGQAVLAQMLGATRQREIV